MSPTGTTTSENCWRPLVLLKKCISLKPSNSIPMFLIQSNMGNLHQKTWLTMLVSVLFSMARSSRSRDWISVSQPGWASQCGKLHISHQNIVSQVKNTSVFYHYWLCICSYAFWMQALQWKIWNKREKLIWWILSQCLLLHSSKLKAASKSQGQMTPSQLKANHLPSSPSTHTHSTTFPVSKLAKQPSSPGALSHSTCTHKHDLWKMA